MFGFQRRLKNPLLRDHEELRKESTREHEVRAQKESTGREQGESRGREHGEGARGGTRGRRTKKEDEKKDKGKYLKKKKYEGEGRGIYICLRKSELR